MVLDKSSDTSSCRSFLLLVSDALNSIRSKPNSLQTTWTVVVFPIPGGPDNKAALKKAPLSSFAQGPNKQN